MIVSEQHGLGICEKRNKESPLFPTKQGVSFYTEMLFWSVMLSKHFGLYFTFLKPYTKNAASKNALFQLLYLCVAWGNNASSFFQVACAHYN